MKNVIRGFVMLSVIFCLMVMGCPTEDTKEETPSDPAGGKTVAAEYHGTYKSSHQTYSWALNEKNFSVIGYSYRVWTESNEFWTYAPPSAFNTSSGLSDVPVVMKLGYFNNNQLIFEVEGWMKGTYVKQ